MTRLLILPAIFALATLGVFALIRFAPPEIGPKHQQQTQQKHPEAVFSNTKKLIKNYNGLGTENSAKYVLQYSVEYRAPNGGETWAKTDAKNLAKNGAENGKNGQHEKIWLKKEPIDFIRPSRGRYHSGPQQQIEEQKQMPLFAFELSSSVDNFTLMANRFRAYEANHSIYIAFLFTSLYLYKQTFAIPGSFLLNVLAGILYGLWPGVVLCSVLTTAGATTCYLFSELFSREYVLYYFGERISYLQQKVDDNSHRLFAFLLFARMFPISPSWLLNIVAPFLNIPIPVFAVSAFVGLAPYNFLCVQAGSILGELHNWDDVFSVANMIKLGSLAFIPLLFAAVRKPPRPRAFFSNGVTTAAPKTGCLGCLPLKVRRLFAGGLLKHILMVFCRRRTNKKNNGTVGKNIERSCCVKDAFILLPSSQNSNLLLSREKGQKTVSVDVLVGNKASSVGDENCVVAQTQQQPHEDGTVILKMEYQQPRHLG